MIATPEPGVYYDVSERQYHNWPAVSKSKLWRLHKVMDLEYDPKRLQELVLSERPESDALAMGRLVDDLLFAPDEARARYEFGPTKTRGAKAWKEREAELEDGTSLVTQDELDRAVAMSESVARHPIASDLLMQGRGHKQLSIVADHEDTGLRCKGRIDRLTDYHGQTAHVDLKTCRSVKWFPKDAEDYGYWIQAAHYLDLAERIKPSGSQRRFIFVAIEKTADPEAPGHHRIVCFEYDLHSLDSALRMRDSLLDKWRRLFQDGKYPGEQPDIKPMRISEKSEQAMEPSL